MHKVNLRASHQYSSSKRKQKLCVVMRQVDLLHLRWKVRLVFMFLRARLSGRKLIHARRLVTCRGDRHRHGHLQITGITRRSTDLNNLVDLICEKPRDQDTGILPVGHQWKIGVRRDAVLVGVEVPDAIVIAVGAWIVFDVATMAKVMTTVVNAEIVEAEAEIALDMVTGMQVDMIGLQLAKETKLNIEI